ncbi:MAG TPA: CU044_5270 family protein [Actinophytocola sp.]|nr:CU044_5270 family protein [Actinophytocola sp.]
MPDNVREMWSDDQLDAALAVLRFEVDTDDERLKRARAELLAAAGPPAHVPRWPRRRWWAAAAAVAAVVAGVLVAPFGNQQPVASAAARELNSAADKIGTSDERVGPGQYRYVATHAWYLQTDVVSESKQFSYFEEHLMETWAPADWRQEWLRRDTVTGKRQWVEGSEAEAKAAGMAPPPRRTSEDRAPCGGFSAELEGLDPCLPGNWDQVTPGFMDTLPRDSRQLYDTLRDYERRNHGDGDLSFRMLSHAAELLHTGLVPADLRAALYRMLGMVPGLRITEKVANLDGREGIAFGVAREDQRLDVIIDPATGQYIGERTVTLTVVGGVPAGTVLEYTSVDVAVVDRQGQR